MRLTAIMLLSQSGSVRLTAIMLLYAHQAIRAINVWVRQLVCRLATRHAFPCMRVSVAIGPTAYTLKPDSTLSTGIDVIPVTCCEFIH